MFGAQWERAGGVFGLEVSRLVARYLSSVNTVEQVQD